MWANRYNARHWLMEAPAPLPILRVDGGGGYVRRIRGGGEEVGTCSGGQRRGQSLFFFDCGTLFRGPKNASFDVHLNLFFDCGAFVPSFEDQKARLSRVSLFYIPGEDSDFSLSQDYSAMDASFFNHPALAGPNFDPAASLHLPAPQQTEDDSLPPIAYYNTVNYDSVDDEPHDEQHSTSYDDDEQHDEQGPGWCKNHHWHDGERPSTPQNEEERRRAKAPLLEVPPDPSIALPPQIGGGGLRREASPHETSTRFRTHITPSKRGDADTRAMHQARAQANAHPPSPPPPQPERRPGAGGRSAPPALVFKEKKAAPPPPPQPEHKPEAGGHAAPPPLVFKEKKHAPPPQPEQRPRAPSAAPPPTTAPPPRAPAAAPTAVAAPPPRAPAPAVDLAAVGAAGPMSCAGPSKRPLRPDAEMPQLHLQPATPPLQPAASQSIMPERFRGQWKDFLAQGGFQQAPLPPPPNPCGSPVPPSHRRSPTPPPRQDMPPGADSPPVPRRMPSVPPAYSPASRGLHRPQPLDVSPIKRLQLGNWHFNDTEAGGETDDAEGSVDGDAEGDAEGSADGVDDVPIYEPAKPGRPTKEQTAALHKCRGRVLALLKTLRDEYKISPARVLDEVTKVYKGTASRSKNPWNIYCQMAKHPDYCEAEIQRILPTFECDAHEMPTLSQDHISQMYQAFQAAYVEDDEYLKVLQDFESVHMWEGEPTVAQRQRKVTRSAKRIERVMDDLRDSERVEGMFVLCGSSVNADSDLGHHYATSGLAEFTSVFKGGKDHPGLTADDFLGMAKTFVYQNQLQAVTEDGLIPPDADGHAAASHTTTKRAAKLSASSKPSASTSTKTKSSAGATVKSEDAAVMSRSQTDTELNKKVRQLIIDACIADIGHDVMQQGSMFRWKSSVARIRKEGYILVGFPVNVRFPCQSTDGKATASWRKPHRESLTKAINARGVPGHGMRFERVGEEPLESDIVIFSHDYSVPSPAGPNATFKHWRTSGGKYLPCEDGRGKLWLVKYDLDRPNGRVLGKRSLSTETTETTIAEEDGEVEEVSALRRRVKPGRNALEEDEDSVEEIPPPPRRRTKKKAENKVKPKPKTKPKPKPKVIEAQQEGGGGKTVAFNISDDEQDELSALTASEYQDDYEPSAPSQHKPSARSQGKRPIDEGSIAQPQKRSRHDAPALSQPSAPTRPSAPAQPSAPHPSAQSTTSDAQVPVPRKRRQEVGESGSESKRTKLSIDVPQAMPQARKKAKKQAQPPPPPLAVVDRSPDNGVFTGTFYDLNAKPAGKLYAARPGEASMFLVPAGERGDNPHGGDPFGFGRAVPVPSRGGSRGGAGRVDAFGFSEQAVAGPSQPVPKPKPAYRGASHAAVPPASSAPPAPPAPALAPSAPAPSAMPAVPAGYDFSTLLSSLPPDVLATLPPDLLAATIAAALQNKTQGPG
ncbi:hypothetical protein B0H12DRAFT_1071979 [Mycena haematopus]|nr:hypothetical protein B0H12DRAFT_1071979 [Mycena haematopus]